MGILKSVQHFHGLAAAAGDHLALLNVQQLVTDGTVDIALLLCPDHKAKTTFEFAFHSILLKHPKNLRYIELPSV